MWKPVSLNTLNKQIIEEEFCMTGSCGRFWNYIKITPEKWELSPYGDEGGGFWVVAVIGKNCIYFNDIEDGFNTSSYETYGKINNYYSNQGDLFSQVNYLYNEIIQRD